MNCNDAFDRMTSPDAALDVALHRHWEECRRCRAMRDTLSPALEWLSAAPERTRGREADDRRSVFLTDEAVLVAERAARRLSPPSPEPGRRARSRTSSVRWLALGGIVALGLFAVFAPPDRQQPTTTERAAAPSVPLSECLWLKSAEARRGAAAEAQQVVASCVTCHLSIP